MAAAKPTITQPKDWRRKARAEAHKAAAQVTYTSGSGMARLLNSRMGTASAQASPASAPAHQPPIIRPVSKIKAAVSRPKATAPKRVQKITVPGEIQRPPLEDS